MSAMPAAVAGDEGAVPAPERYCKTASAGALGTFPFPGVRSRRLIERRSDRLSRVDV
jgi:hypothetical protein